MSSPIRTIAAPLSFEGEKVRGSRFFAHLAPVGDVDAAQRFIAAIRRRFADATHNCYAWRLSDRDDGFRYSDAGEPSGSAGRPMLDRLSGRELVRVAAVVTRYFGGTKLGRGGLARAYAGALAAALERAEIVELPRTTALALSFDYSRSGAVDAVLAAHALEPTEARYGAGVRLVVETPIDALEHLVLQLRERCAGRITIAEAGEADEQP